MLNSIRRTGISIIRGLDGFFGLHIIKYITSRITCIGAGVPLYISGAAIVRTAHIIKYIRFTLRFFKRGRKNIYLAKSMIV
jgi:hypothetical protein